MDWTASESASWLSVVAGERHERRHVTVTPSITGLAAGTYTADVTVTAAGVAGSPKTIPVTLTVDPPTPPALSVTPATLSFSATAGGASPAAKTLAVSNTGGGSHGLDGVGERELAERVAGAAGRTPARSR